MILYIRGVISGEKRNGHPDSSSSPFEGKGTSGGKPPDVFRLYTHLQEQGHHLEKGVEQRTYAKDGGKALRGFRSTQKCGRHQKREPDRS